MEIPALERPSLPRVADSHTAHSMSMLPVLFLKSRIISRHRHFQQKRFPHNQQAHQNNKVTSKVYFRQSFDQIYIINWTGQMTANVISRAKVIPISYSRKRYRSHMYTISGNKTTTFTGKHLFVLARTPTYPTISWNLSRDYLWSAVLIQRWSAPDEK